VLWLAGEGDCSQTLREQVQELELEAKVRFLGYLQPEELRDITPKAYIGLNLLENRGLSYYYSLANKAFDYLQAGVPAIHMAFPEYEALHRAHPGFLLLDKLEPSALATVLNQLLQDEALYKKLREACRLAAAELTWEREEGRLLEVYQSLKTSMR
jgi:glycosyltransferase involved in cell wall biosynthesis